MFKENAKHEMGIKKSYIDNVRNNQIPFGERMRLIKQGANIRVTTRHMDRKVLRCYPRGKVFFKMVEMHTYQQLHAK